MGNGILLPQSGPFLDERVHSGHERIVNCPEKRPCGEQHRVQYVFLIRHDKLQRFDRDLGPVSKFPLANMGFSSLFLFEYGVGEVLEIMEYHRYNLPEPVEPTDLWGEWRKELDEKRNLRANRSSFGPLVTIQRNYR